MPAAVQEKQKKSTAIAMVQWFKLSEFERYTKRMSKIFQIANRTKQPTNKNEYE